METSQGNIISFKDNLGDSDYSAIRKSEEGSVNINNTERIASAISGGALAVYGLTRGGWKGFATAAVGGMFLYRGLSGHCDIYQMLGMGSSKEENPNVSVQGGTGVKVEKRITINKSPEEIYKFWRKFENLPRFMNHLESVTTSLGGRSHWVAKAPAGTTVEWDAEIINDHPNEMIAWRSLEGSEVANAGSVHFTPTADESSTEVRVVLKYNPPAGRLGAMVARLFGENPEQQIEEDLQRFKELMETGALAKSQGGF